MIKFKPRERARYEENGESSGTCMDVSFLFAFKRTTGSLVGIRGHPIFLPIQNIETKSTT
jgi:hypothetical protein